MKKKKHPIHKIFIHSPINSPHVLAESRNVKFSSSRVCIHWALIVRMRIRKLKNVVVLLRARAYIDARDVNRSESC